MFIQKLAALVAIFEYSPVPPASDRAITLTVHPVAGYLAAGVVAECNHRLSSLHKNDSLERQLLSAPPIHESRLTLINSKIFPDRNQLFTLDGESARPWAWPGMNAPAADWPTRTGT